MEQDDGKVVEDDDEKCQDVLVCGICKNKFDCQTISDAKLARLAVKDKAVSGSWHCGRCAMKPIAIYTTWISLSNARPCNSILSVCPGTHRLTQWDMPKKRKLVPGDFTWELKWAIPSEVGLGDVIIFNVKTVHAASRNTSRPATFRVSCDTRIQLS